MYVYIYIYIYTYYIGQALMTRTVRYGCPGWIHARSRFCLPGTGFLQKWPAVGDAAMPTVVLLGLIAEALQERPTKHRAKDAAG